MFAAVLLILLPALFIGAALGTLAFWITLGVMTVATIMLAASTDLFLS